MAKKNWPLSMMYKDHYSPLGFNGKLDYWENKEKGHDFWCKNQGQAQMIRESYLFYLEDSESQGKLTPEYYI